MKLSEFRGEEAIEVVADLLEPTCELVSDKEFISLLREKGKRMAAVKVALKNHKAAVIEIMAALEREDPEEYEENVNVFTFPKKLLDILNDKDLIELFRYQGQTVDAASFGSVSENSEEKI